MSGGFDADIAIIGAGPAGQALALAIAEAGWRTCLLDAAPAPPAMPTKPDLRVFALSPASIRLLTSIGAWPVPQRDRVHAYRRMQVWEHDPAHGLHFDAAALGWSSLGSIVEHAVLQYALAQRIAQQPGLELRFGARLATIESEDSGVTAVLDGGERLRVRLLVGADGAESSLRRLAGIDTTGIDYDQCGLVANVRTAVPHADTARQRFLPHGPLAFLPLADGGCSIVWSLPTDESARLKTLPDAAFERELAAAAGGVLGTIVLESARVAFPLRRQLARRYHDRRVVLVGDAAHVVHPLAGQGLNLGLLDVAALADVLAGARSRGLDPGSAAMLARYGRWRQGDNAAAAYAFEAIDRLYRMPLSVMHTARAVGQRFMDALPPLKRRLILHASGLGGRVPSRCRIKGA